MVTRTTAARKPSAKKAAAKKAVVKKALTKTKVAKKASTKKPAKKTMKSQSVVTRKQPNRGLDANTIGALNLSSGEIAIQGGQEVNLTLAWNKPDWQVQLEQHTRPLWQIAALACGIDPDQKSVGPRKAIDPQWSEQYQKLLSAMSNAVSSIRKADHIFFDKDLAGNIARVNSKYEVRNLRVDAASASAFVIKKFGMKIKLPVEFRELHEYLKNSASKANDEIGYAATKKVVKSDRQDSAKETKDSNRLAVLLYVHLEKKVGWAQKRTSEKKAIVEDLIEDFKLHDFIAGYGYGADSIEELIERGRVLAPLRK